MKAMQQDLTSVCTAAGEWYLRSGIQEANGGVARYYYSDRKRNAPLTTEITAYAAGGLVRMAKQEGDSRYMDAAVKAANYLVKAWDAKCAAMPFEVEAEGSRYSYFFDNGIIIRALLQVWRERATEEFLATAVKVGDSMMRDFADDKHFNPILELPGKKALPLEPKRWSRSSACYQLKAAMGWFELWQITKDERYMACYRQMLNASIESHIDFLPGSDTDIPVMDRLHPYSYFLEGLLPVYSEPAAAEATRVGIERLAAFARKVEPLFLRSDVLAQLLRVRLFAEQNGVARLNEDAAQQEVAWMQEFQSEDSDPRLKGGFWFGRKGKEMLPFMNPVSTAFCYQALEMWNERGNKLEWETLV
jgi:hypothetical protein